MPWFADDDEINGIIDSNLKDSPPNPPAVNSAETVRNLFKAFWASISGQVSDAVDAIETKRVGTYNAVTGLATVEKTGETFTLSEVPPIGTEGKSFLCTNSGLNSSAGLSEMHITGDELISASVKWFRVPVGGAQEQILNDLTTVNSLSELAMVRTQKASAKQKSPLVPDSRPLYCFSINNDSANQARQLINAAYPDNMFNQHEDAWIGDGRGVFHISPKTPGTLQIRLNSNSKASIDLPIVNFVTNLSAVTQKILWLPIGDSVTALPYYPGSGELQDYWGYPSKALYNNLRDKVDLPALPQMVMLGHLNVRSKVHTYKSQNLTVKGGNGAMAGWAGCHYLYDAIRTSGKVVTEPGYLTPELSYYIKGLKGQTTLNYAGTPAQIDLIRTSIMGKNPCDKVAVLYDYMKVQPGWGGAVDAYTGSAGQNTAMDTYFETVLDNPSNPFYSKDKARTVGSTNAFSVAAYVARYKTLANDGVTRLTIGTTAGPKVTNVNDHDVCDPTHITFNFAENDLWLFPDATPTQHAAVIRELTNTAAAEYPTTKIGILTNPYPGTNFPELFDPGIRHPKLATNYKKAQVRDAIIANLGVSPAAVKTGNIYYIDAFMFMNPLSHQLDQAGESAGRSVDFAETQLSGVHPGFYAQASLGDQVLGWLYYSTNN